LEEDKAALTYLPFFIPQSAIRNPQSEDLTKAARLSDAVSLQS
jgi:hypothetical protein